MATSSSIGASESTQTHANKPLAQPVQWPGSRRNPRRVCAAQATGGAKLAIPTAKATPRLPGCSALPVSASAIKCFSYDSNRRCAIGRQGLLRVIKAS